MIKTLFKSMKLCVLAVLFFVGCSSGSSSSLPPSPASPFVANGPVSAIAVANDGTTYIGGAFTRVGPATGGFVPIDATTGQPLSSFPKVNGTVNVLTPDGSGGQYIGGSFTYVGGVNRNNIAHILSDGSVDASWNPDSTGSGSVAALVVSGNTVYIGGSFTSMGSQSRNHLAALDTITGAVTSWDPNADSNVNALAIIGNTVFSGGTFTSMGGQARNYLAALDAATGAVTSWNPNADNYVNVLTVSGSTLYAGGWFTSIGSHTRNRLAAFDMAGNLTSWNPSINYNPPGSPDLSSYVLALTVNGNTVYAGGFFQSITTAGSITTTRNYLAAFDATTGAVTSWDPNANSTVNALAIDNGTVYTGGSFTNIGGQSRNSLAALDAATGAVISWNPNPNGVVNALATSNGAVYAGGSFTSVGGQTRIRLAALDAEGNLISWNPSISYTLMDSVTSILALAVGGNTVYAGGYFTSITSGSTTTVRNYLAAFDAATGAVTSWNPNSIDYITALAVNGNTVYAGGNFTSIGGLSRNHLAALDATTGAVTSWNPIADMVPLAFVVGGNSVYAGGYTLGSTGGRSAFSAALEVFDATTGAVADWNPNPQSGGRINFVSALALNGNTVYAGGTFTSMGGQARNYLAALDATTGAVASWNPNPNGAVNALAISDGIVYAGGDFTSIGGQTRSHLAGLDATTGAVTSWDPNPNSTVNALAISNSAVLAGGSFTSVGMSPLSYFARISK